MHHTRLAVDKDLWVTMVRRWGIAFLVSGLFFGLDTIGWLKWLRGDIERVIAPLDSRVLWLVGETAAPWRWIQAGRTSSSRIANLEERLALAAVDRSRLRELEEKVTSLESLVVRVGGGKRADRIVPLLDYGDRVMVATGMSDGVMAGQVLTDSQGVLIGKIDEVGEYLSGVMLVSDVGSWIAVQTQTGFSKGIVVGRGAVGKAVLTEVLQSEPLSVGDILVTTGVDKSYPAGLVVGQVVELTGKPEDVTRGGIVALLTSRKGWVALW